MQGTLTIRQTQGDDIVTTRVPITVLTYRRDSAGQGTATVRLPSGTITTRALGSITFDREPVSHDDRDNDRIIADTIIRPDGTYGTWSATIQSADGTYYPLDSSAPTVKLTRAECARLRDEVAAAGILSYSGWQSLTSWRGSIGREMRRRARKTLRQLVHSPNVTAWLASESRTVTRSRDLTLPVVHACGWSQGSAVPVDDPTAAETAQERAALRHWTDPTTRDATGRPMGAVTVTAPDGTTRTDLPDGYYPTPRPERASPECPALAAADLAGEGGTVTVESRSERTRRLARERKSRERARERAARRAQVESAARASAAASLVTYSHPWE